MPPVLGNCSPHVRAALEPVPGLTPTAETEGKRKLGNKGRDGTLSCPESNPQLLGLCPDAGRCLISGV